jgi:hypothetical protein
MGAANNATTVFYGTAWDDTSLLNRERQRAQELEKGDGIKRAFVIPWTVPAAELPLYKRYVEGERERLGATHPLFTTQYELIPLAGKGRFFSVTMRAQLAGEYERRAAPPAAATMAAGLDLAGGGDDLQETHDRTVLTLGAVTPAGPADTLPENHAAVLHHVAWQGVPHEELLPQLLDLVQLWKPATLAVDATGLGEPTARVLAARCPKTMVVPIKFSRPSKSELGFDLKSSVSTGRLKMYADDGSPEWRTFWEEVRLGREDLLPGGYINFYVDASEGHDDYLMSLALFGRAAAMATPRVARGRRP